MVELYDAEFYRNEEEVALAAAQIILPDLLDHLTPQDGTWTPKVVDVGGGTGAWAKIAEWYGAEAVLIDGFVPPDRVLVGNHIHMGLESGTSCKGYDLAICLEVAEHLPETSASALVAGLCKAPFVLFSAAIPEQGGVGHINEQWPSYWAEIFAEHGYVPSGDIRAKHWGDQRVQDFYRQNILLFSTPDRLAQTSYSIETDLDRVHPDLAKAKGWT